MRNSKKGGFPCFNFDQSQGFSNDFDDNNSRMMFSRQKEESSLSFPLKLTFGNQEESNRIGYQQFFNIEDTINFNDMLNKQSYIKQEQNQQQHVSLISQKSSPSSPLDDEFQDQDKSSEKSKNCERKGLKYFAKLLLKILENKEVPISQKQLEIDMEGFLLKQLQDSNNKTNELKNIKRRCYDAINVMLSAGVIEKKHNHFLIVNSQKNTHNNFNSIDKISEIRAAIAQKRYLIRKKKEIFERQGQKYLAIEEWISNKKKIKHQNKNRSVSKHKILQFPIVFVKKQDESFRMHFPTINKESVWLLSNELKIDGELDAITHYLSEISGQIKLEEEEGKQFSKSNMRAEMFSQGQVKLEELDQNDIFAQIVKKTQ